MDLDDGQYSGRLRRFFFGDESWKLAAKDSDVEKMFRKFFSKLQTRIQRLKQQARKTEDKSEHPALSSDIPGTSAASNILGFRDGGFDRRLTMRVAIDVLKKNDFELREFTQLRRLRASQASLPIAEKRAEILQTLQNVPQYLLDAGYDRIACTQPRRIAATVLARRVAYETLNEYGSKIAYQIRFERTRTMKTRLLFLTEGLLLRQLQTDPQLSQYSVCDIYIRKTVRA
ncbi:unnamed protein product [Gongylonema pulchrum]|uniref:Uncharacterized protein n=1 Tax=Gongylonema pulchrum TaxID=637853 RepID=A0A183EJQ6_9BILA|nr:unnamed protein product [Gongylonema pulchrum]